MSVIALFSNASYNFFCNWKSSGKVNSIQRLTNLIYEAEKLDPAERKQIILQSAKKVFAEKGYHDTGVADVIAEAKVARGTFYLYFKSKSAIFSALIENIMQSVVERLTPFSMENQDEILKTLRMNMDAIRDYFLNDPHSARILIHETFALDNDSKEQLMEMKQRLLMWMSNIVMEAQQLNILRQMDPMVMALSFFGAMKEMLEATLITGNISNDISNNAFELLEMYMFGLVTPEYQDQARQNLLDLKQ